MKTHNINGKDVSEETIVEALKEHCSFEEQKEPRVDVFLFSAYLSDAQTGVYFGGSGWKNRDPKLHRENHLGFYTKDEVKEVIRGLQEMVDYLEKQ